MRLARCSRGDLGLVVRKPHAVKYGDGTYGFAWTGVHLPRFWRRWSSRNPRWVNPPWGSA